MSFILRTHSKQTGVQTNVALGNSYTLVNSEWAVEEFKRTNDSWKAAELHEPGELYAYILTEDGSDVVPLFKRCFNYVMTGDGKTFANVTFKD